MMICDSVIHAAHDVLMQSAIIILKCNPSGKENVIPLQYIKTEAELEIMTPEEIDKYQRELDDYNIKVNTNCGDQANPV